MNIPELMKRAAEMIDEPGVGPDRYEFADELRAAAAEMEKSEPVCHHPVAPAVTEWPKALPEQATIGWTLDYDFLDAVNELAALRTDFTTSMESTEQVLIAAKELLPASPEPDTPEDWLQPGHYVYVKKTGRGVRVYSVTEDDGVFTTGGNYCRTELCPDAPTAMKEAK